MSGDSRTVLVTGGAGFAGSWLVELLLGCDETSRVVVLDNFSNGRRSHVPDSPRVTVAEVDLRDREGVSEAVCRARPDVVFHLAALHYIPYCNEHPAEALEVNVVGTQNLLDACREAEPTALVAASTVAVYPVRNEANAEDSPLGPVDVYGISKWINERQVEHYARDSKTRCSVARLSNIYGLRETNPHVIPEIIGQMLAGRDELALGNTKPRRDYVYVADVAGALMTIAAKSNHRYRVYNVGTGEEYSVDEIVSYLAEISGRPLRVDVDPRRVRASDRMHLVCDLGRIRGELDWSPEHSIRSGLATLWRDAIGLAPAAATRGDIVRGLS